MSTIAHIKALKPYNTKFTCPLNGQHLKAIITEIETALGSETLANLKARPNYNTNKGIALTGYNIKELIEQIESIGVTDSSYLTRLNYIKNEYWYNTKYEQFLNGVHVKYLIDCIENLNSGSTPGFYLYELVIPYNDSTLASIEAITIDGVSYTTEYLVELGGGIPAAHDPFSHLAAPTVNWMGGSIYQLFGTAYANIVKDPEAAPYQFGVYTDIGSMKSYIFMITEQEHEVKFTSEAVEHTMYLSDPAYTPRNYELLIDYIDPATDQVTGLMFEAPDKDGTLQMVRVNSSGIYNYNPTTLDDYEAWNPSNGTGWLGRFESTITSPGTSSFLMWSADYQDIVLDSRVFIQVRDMHFRAPFAIETNNGTFSFLPEGTITP